MEHVTSFYKMTNICLNIAGDHLFTFWFFLNFSFDEDSLSGPFHGKFSAVGSDLLCSVKCGLFLACFSSPWARTGGTGARWEWTRFTECDLVSPTALLSHCVELVAGSAGELFPARAVPDSDTGQPGLCRDVGRCWRFSGRRDGVTGSRSGFGSEVASGESTDGTEVGRLLLGTEKREEVGILDVVGDRVLVVNLLVDVLPLVPLAFPGLFSGIPSHFRPF